MSTKQLLENFVELRNMMIIASNISPKTAIQRKVLVLALKTCKMQIQYAAARRQHGDVDLVEPFSPEDRANIRQADKVNREIGKYLNDLRKAKKAAVTRG